MAFAHDIAGGQGNLIATALKSPNFVHAQQGWSIGRDGSAEFHDLILPDGQGVSVFFAGTAPSTSHVGDLWYDTANGLQLSRWDGTAWTAYQIGTGAIAAGTITASLLAAGIVVAGIVDATTITGATIIADGASGEFLAYSGAPAAGNLIASVAAVAGTDSHGNAYKAGVWAYGSSGGACGIFNNGTYAVLSMPPAGATVSTAAPSVYSGTYNAGLADECQYVNIDTGSSNNERDVGLFLVSEPADASASEQLQLVFGETLEAVMVSRNGLYVDPTVPVAVNGETWHTMILNNSWVVDSGGFAQYKLMPDNTVMIRLANVAPGTVTDGTSIWTAPAGYRATQVMSLLLNVNWGTARSLASMPRLVTRSTGDLEVYGLGSGVSNINAVAVYPLD